MQHRIQAEILAASQPLRIPGGGERRILTPQAVGRLATAAELPRWELEAQALETEVIPLHYLRNLAFYDLAGQARMLRASVALVGNHEVLLRAVELLAPAGIGRFRLLRMEGDTQSLDPVREAIRRRNSSSEVTALTLNLKAGRPGETLRGVDAVGACLDQSLDEQLLQFACRAEKLPLLLTGAEGLRGQAITVLPGDVGIALVYKPSHPHLESRRDSAFINPKAALMVGSWMLEQLTRLVLGQDGLLRDRLLYADMEAGDLGEYPLAG